MLLARVGLFLLSLWLIQRCLPPIRATDYLPTSGTGDDRWWSAVLILGVSSFTGCFLLFIGLAVAILPASSGPWSWRAVLTVGAVGLCALAVQSIWQVVRSGELGRVAERRWREDVDAASVQLLSDLDVHWRDANAMPIVLGERASGSGAPLPPVAAQLERHKKRLEEWNKGAKKVLDKLKTIDGEVVAAVDAAVARAAAGGAKPDVGAGEPPSPLPVEVPGDSILQVVEAGGEEPHPGRPHKLTRDALEGRTTVSLWYATKEQVEKEIVGARAKLDEPRSRMLGHAAEFRAGRLGAVADVLRRTAMLTDRLRFAWRVHPLSDTARDDSKVRGVLISPETFGAF
ncbi:MAG TPA: hypothetical protein VNQ33_12925, partial [Acidimicrobiales bacterium]|nr:hypothetical protein [Acidimicrobiales bacterium]